MRSVGGEVGVSWNANEGTTTTVGELIQPLEQDLAVADMNYRLRGNLLMAACTVPSFQAAADILNAVNVLLPTLLSSKLGVYVWPRSISACLGEATIVYEVSRLHHVIRATTTSENEEGVKEALFSAADINEGFSRVVSALLYYRQAQRLVLLEPDRHPMLSEILLNLAKAIEVVFTANHEEVRERARRWNFPEKEVEERLIPLLILRSKVDVAHPAVTPLTEADCRLLCNFAMHATTAVGVALERIYAGVRSGSIQLEPVDRRHTDTRRQLLDRIEMYIHHSVVQGRPGG